MLRLKSSSSFQMNGQAQLKLYLFARENARMVRDQLSEEIWVELNSIYHFFRNSDAEGLFKEFSTVLSKITEVLIGISGFVGFNRSS